VRFRHLPQGIGEEKHRYATGFGADGGLTGEGAYAEISAVMFTTVINQ